MSRMLRFVHAADLRLEKPLSGLTEIPDHLHELLADAPRMAAERVFDTALVEQADGLILSGGVLDPERAGPAPLAFLLDQFERLAARDITVFWLDRPRAWPAAVPLPAHVQHVGAEVHGQWSCLRHGEVVAQLAGLGTDRRRRVRTSDLAPSAPHIPLLAVGWGRVSADALRDRGVAYWALGGRAERRTLDVAPSVAHYAGTPQGREPAEAGPRGCTLATVDGEHPVRLQFHVTDVVRWHSEVLVCDQPLRDDQLYQQAAARARELITHAARACLLVHWTVQLSPEVERALRPTGLARDLLLQLRREFGHQSSPLWSTGVEIRSSQPVSSEWYDEDTILGDFLRAVRELENDPQRIPDLADMAPGQFPGAGSRAPDDLADPVRRARVLYEITRRGAALLRGGPAT